MGMEYDLTRTSHQLMKAAHLIQEKGWDEGIHGWDEHVTPGLCIEGALAAAAGIDWRTCNITEFMTCPAYRAVQEFLVEREQLPVTRMLATNVHGGTEDTDELWAWNDNAAEDQWDVINTLKAAAIVELAKEKNAEYDLRDAVNEAMAPAAEPELAVA